MGTTNLDFSNSGKMGNLDCDVVDPGAGDAAASRNGLTADPFTP